MSRRKLAWPAVDRLPISAVRLSRDARIITVNRVLEQRHAWRRADIHGMRYRAVFGDVADPYRSIRAAHQHRNGHVQVIASTLADGSPAYVKCTSWPTRDGGIIGYGEDITEALRLAALRAFLAAPVRKGDDLTARVGWLLRQGHGLSGVCSAFGLSLDTVAGMLLRLR